MSTVEKMSSKNPRNGVSSAVINVQRNTKVVKFDGLEITMPNEHSGVIGVLIYKEEILR